MTGQPYTREPARGLAEKIAESTHAAEDHEALRVVIDSAFGTDAAHGLIAKRLTDAGWIGPARVAALTAERNALLDRLSERTRGKWIAEDRAEKAEAEVAALREQIPAVTAREKALREAIERLIAKNEALLCRSGAATYTGIGTDALRAVLGVTDA